MDDRGHGGCGVGTSIDTLKIAVATAQDTLSGAGDLVFIRFAVSDSAAPGDTTALCFEAFMFNQGDPGAATHDGEVAIEGLFGDVSGNDQVQAYDAALILQETVDIIILPDPDWPAFIVGVADVSGDGEISAYDASLVLRYVVDRIAQFPVSPKWAVFGRAVRLGSAESLSDGSFEVPVLIDEMEGVLSGQIEVCFDRAAFRAIGVAKSDRTKEYLFAGKVFEDKIKCSFAGAESKSGQGRIATIRFERIGADFDGMEGIALRSVQLNEGRISVSLLSAQSASEVPKAYRLCQNFPNPFNAGTWIRGELPRESRARLRIYNLSGQTVRTLVDSNIEAGSWNVLWDGLDEQGREVSSGVYFYRLAVDGGRWTKTMKMIMLR